MKRAEQRVTGVGGSSKTEGNTRGSEEGGASRVREGGSIEADESRGHETEGIVEHKQNSAFKPSTWTWSQEIANTLQRLFVRSSNIFQRSPPSCIGKTHLVAMTTATVDVG